MGNVLSMPTAVLFGATHVSIAQCSTGWAVTAWTRESGPQMVGSRSTYGEARERAQAYADRVGAILDLPEELRRIDVQRCENGELVVIQISAGENNATVLDTFGPHERDAAVAYAMRMLPHFAPCRLGEIAS